MGRRAFEPTTGDSNAAKRRRVEEFLRNPDNHHLSNRFIARGLQVDEAMVRDWKAKLGIPPLAVGSGKPPGDKGPRRRKRRRS